MKRKAIEKIEPTKTRKKRAYRDSPDIRRYCNHQCIQRQGSGSEILHQLQNRRTRILDRKEWLEERKTHNSNRRKLVRMGMDETCL